MMNRKKQLPALKKALGVCVVFALFFLGFLSLLPQKTPVAAALTSDCISYATCHFYNGPDSAVCTDPRLPVPVKDCICHIYPKAQTGLSYDIVSKSVNNVCARSLALDCNSFPKTGVTCPVEYRGDFCGCSGPKKPLPETNSTPTPIPTPPPVQAACYQACQTDADCSGNLACGYHVKAGQRVCHNPSCARETDCTCSWQTGIQAAFARLQGLSFQSKKSGGQSFVSRSSSRLKSAWERLRALRRN